MIVKHEDGVDIYSVLEEAIRINNIEEVSKIIDSLRGCGNDPLDIMNLIKRRIDELDPHNPEDVINYILNHMDPEVRSLLEPTKVIMSLNTKSKRHWLQCFRVTGK
jgi:hypothetical protein